MTLYAFSRENWARSDEEVTGLFGLLEMVVFIALVFVAYVYVRRKGGLDWNVAGLRDDAPPVDEAPPLPPRGEAVGAH